MELKKRCLPKICPGALSKEHVIFSKMLHRARNQQRHDLSFQKMTGVSKKVKKYLVMVNLPQKLRVIMKELFSVRGAIADSTVEAAEELCGQLLEAAAFTAGLLQFIEETWREVNQRLVKALFVPFNTVMLASLSRIWVCVRVNLLGIAETYAVLKNTVPRARAPVSHVVTHLKEAQRSYLDTPALRHLHPPQTSASDLSTSVQRYCGDLQRNSAVMATDDTGVAVTLTEEEMLARARDFQTPSDEGLSTSAVLLRAPPGPGPELQPTGGGGGLARAEGEGEVGKSCSREGKRRKRKKGPKSLSTFLCVKKLGKRPSVGRKDQLSISSQSSEDQRISPSDGVKDSEPSSVECAKADENKCLQLKRKHRSRAKRLRKRRKSVSGFRLVVVRRHGVQKLVFGRKVWAARKAKKRATLDNPAAAGPRASTSIGDSLSWAAAEGEDITSNGLVDWAAGQTGGIRDDIDRIFSDLS